MSVVLYLILLSGRWQFMAIDPAPMPTDRCIRLREQVAESFTGRDGNMRVVCSENWMEL